MKTTTSAIVQDLAQSIVEAADSVHNPGPQGLRSRTAVRAAARQLLLETATPDEYCREQTLRMTEIVALRICMKLGIFAAIPDGRSISLQDLADAVTATESLVERPCRILVGVGFLGQNHEGYYHTRFSSAWKRIDIAGPATYFQGVYDVYLRSSVSIWEFIESRRQTLYADPSSYLDTPVSALYGKPGQKQGTWDALANHPEMIRTFAIAMKAGDALIPATGFFDFGQLSAQGPLDDRVQVVDIGSGVGDVMRQILDAHPQLCPHKCVAQDMQHIIAMTDHLRRRGVKTQVIDFHQTQPVKGAKAYYMRMISHDYGDPEMITILSHIAGAMSPSSRLLIADSVIPDRLDESTLYAGVMDQFMFSVGGRERTEAGFRAILEPNNLELVHIHRARDSAGVIVEARLKR